MRIKILNFEGGLTSPGEDPSWTGTIGPSSGVRKTIHGSTRGRPITPGAGSSRDSGMMDLEKWRRRPRWVQKLFGMEFYEPENKS